MADVFISYRRDLGQDIAWNVFHFLQNEGYTVFMDRDALRVGANFPDALRRGINTATDVIVLVTTNCLTNRALSSAQVDYFLEEIREAIRTGKNVIPFFIGEKPEIPEGTDEYIQSFLLLHGVDYNSADGPKSLGPEKVLLSKPTFVKRLGPSFVPHLPPLKAVVGRDWLDTWLDGQLENRDSGIIVITAPPGFGKTTYFRHRIALEQQNGKSVSYWFTSKQDTPSTILYSIACQLAVSHNVDLRIISDSEITPERAVHELRATLRHIVAATDREDRPNECTVVYIDSVDEPIGDADEPHAMGSILNGLVLPGVIFVISARSDAHVLTHLPPGDAVSSLDIATDAHENNAKALFAYAEHLNLTKNLGLEPDFLRVVSERSGGCFMMLEHLLTHSDAEDLRAWVSGPDTIPNGFTHYASLLYQRFSETVSRNHGRGVVLAIASLIAASHRPISESELTALLRSLSTETRLEPFASATYSDLKQVSVDAIVAALPEVLKQEKGLLIELGRNEDGQPRLGYFHKFMGEFVLKQTNEACNQLFYGLLANGWRAQFTTPIYEADSAADITEFIEHTGQKLVEDWLQAIVPVNGNLSHVAILAWYLYGHMWWDEFTQTFELCSRMVDLLGIVRLRLAHKDNEEALSCTRVYRALGRLRSTWKFTRSVWIQRRPSQRARRSVDVDCWVEALTAYRALATTISERSRNRAAKNSEFALELSVIDASMAIMGAEALHGTGSFEAARSQYDTAIAAFGNCDAYQWAVPYTMIDAADCQYASGIESRALNLLADAIELEPDLQDPEITSQVLRLYGDILWDSGDRQLGVDAYIAALYLAHVVPQGLSGEMDAYYYLYMDEMNWSLMDRLRERYHEDKVDSKKLAERCLDFWQPYLQGNFAGWTRPGVTEIEQLLSMSEAEASGIAATQMAQECILMSDQSAANCPIRVLPAVPELGSEPDFDAMTEAIQERAAALEASLREVLKTHRS